LGRYAFRLLDDYRQQKRQGIKEPTFHRSQIPELANELDLLLCYLLFVILSHIFLSARKEGAKEDGVKN
jgi:hypothetical protein